MREAAMAKAKKTPPKKRTFPVTPVDPNEINPARFYRWNEVVRLRYFGCGNTALDTLVKAGKISKPVKLGKRMVGWYGREIIQLQRDFAASRAA
jgi:predicted DNA-binding transcriptional regulator AlpA